MAARTVILDTETTGLEVREGHRVIEVGLVEYIDRRPTGRSFHELIDPQRSVDLAATEIHGYSDADLVGKPLFAAVADRFVDFVRGAEVLAHNANFDIAFLDRELELLGVPERMTDLCRVVDTLALARSKYPGQRITLTALCSRFGIDDSARVHHGALLDAELLGQVWVAMTSGQERLALNHGERDGENPLVKRHAVQSSLPVIRATPEEESAHQSRLKVIGKKSGKVLWQDSHGMGMG